MYRALLPFACFLLCASAQAHTRLYCSPDGSCTALATSDAGKVKLDQSGSDLGSSDLGSGSVPDGLDYLAVGYGEGTVKIFRRHKLCIRRSFVSDGNHGQIVEHAAWTPNSQFFVFATFSSGGHSAWHHWTFVWSRRDGKIHSLDDAYSSTMTDRFRLTAPDRIRTLLSDSSGSGKPLSVRLSRVQWKPGIGDRR